VQIDELSISQPDTGEQALEIAETLVRSGAADVVVIDSVAALVPKAEPDGEMDPQMGLQARHMSQALRELTGIISKSQMAMIFLNQLRQKIGMFVGNPETTTAGNALKFYASARLDVRRTTQVKDGDETISSRVWVVVRKNKVAPPLRQAEFDILYGEGISREGDLLDLASERAPISKSGARHAYQAARIGQGRENAQKYLREHPQLVAEIEQQLRRELGLVRTSAAEPGSAQDTNGGWRGGGAEASSLGRGLGSKHLRQNGPDVLDHHHEHRETKSFCHTQELEVGENHLLTAAILPAAPAS
jgi:recombination protein RecA